VLSFWIIYFECTPSCWYPGGSGCAKFEVNERNASPQQTKALADRSINRDALELELELELIQTHMTQKPMLRVEVGARVCAQVKSEKYQKIEMPLMPEREKRQSATSGLESPQKKFSWHLQSEFVVKIGAITAKIGDILSCSYLTAVPNMLYGSALAVLSREPVTRRGCTPRR
jgi:hypothetical protein